MRYCIGAFLETAVNCHHTHARAWAMDFQHPFCRYQFTEHDSDLRVTHCRDEAAKMGEVEIIQVRLGGVVLPAAHPRSGDDYPLFGYVVLHDSGPILVDTGAGPGHDRLDSAYELEPVDLPGALETAGVTPTDIAMVINTHLHFDHIGGNRHCPGVPIVAQAAEFEAARSPRYTIGEWVDFTGAELQPVSGTVEIAPGVTVFPTPSHTAGHQSVLVRSDESTEVIVGQALHDRFELSTGVSTEGLPPAVDGFATVAERIKDLRPDRAWFSHHPEPWLREPQASSQTDR